METVPEYWILLEKFWASSSKSHGDQRRSPFVDYSEAKQRGWTAMSPDLNPIRHKGTLARDLQCSRRRRIDKVDISTPVAVHQCAVNCLEEAVQSFIAMRIRCRSSRSDVTFRRLLPVFLVIRGSSVHCFQIRISVELFRRTSSYCGLEKLSFSKADNPPPFRLRKLLEFLLIYPWMHI
ncbi:uncharacterized protein TNCV_2666501 [Trichonephila clavipes]|nr:uncharacterized protein TNCV_2666501 [Trichonephila clavipes]